jgi:hypothetical protein
MSSDSFETSRDEVLLRTVARFTMLTSQQIQATVFRGLRSKSGFRSATDRLLSDGRLVRIEGRRPGGAQGGSGQYVYRVGPRGWALLGRKGSYPRRATIDYHALAIANVYIKLLDAQDKMDEHGQPLMSIHYVEIEDEAYRKVEGQAIRPDMYVELINHTDDTVRLLILEVDNGTENRPVIIDKVNRYRNAKLADKHTYRAFPDVVFLAPDKNRMEQLRRWVGSSITINGDRVFYFGLLSEFPESFY